jgi:hypothetical protein
VQNFFRMFRSKPNAPTTPTTLSFTDILSDLTRLQTYHQTHIGEKIDVLEITKTEVSTEGTTQSNYFELVKNFFCSINFQYLKYV